MYDEMDASQYGAAGQIEDHNMKLLFDRCSQIKNYEFTKGNICYDAKLNDGEVLVEAKVRSVNDRVYKMIKEEGALLEVKKLEYLEKYAELEGAKAIFYIMFFPKQDEILVYNLAKCKMEETTKWCNAQTWGPNNKKVPKKIYLLPYEEANKYSY